MDLRLDLIRHNLWLRQHGLNDSHSGNISIRTEQEYWISPTNACADALQADQLVRCPLNGEPAEDASLDARLHQSIYARHSTARAVIHSHGPYSIALGYREGDFIPEDFEGRFYFPKVPILDIAFERYLEDAPKLVAEALAEHAIVLVRGHGTYTCAANLDQAYKHACSLESSAKLEYLKRPLD